MLHFWICLLVLCIATWMAHGQPVMMSVSTSVLSFNNQALGTSSASEPIELTNRTGAAETSGKWCLHASVDAAPCWRKTSCTYTVTFTPGGMNARHAVLFVNDYWGSQPVALSGTGTLVHFSTGEVSFNNVAIGKMLSSNFTIASLSSSGSTAICAGLPADIPQGVPTDQRGSPRTTNHNGRICVDAGSVQTDY